MYSSVAYKNRYLIITILFVAQAMAIKVYTFFCLVGGNEDGLFCDKLYDHFPIVGTVAFLSGLFMIILDVIRFLLKKISQNHGT